MKAFAKYAIIFLAIVFYTFYHVIHFLIFSLIPRQCRRKKNIKGQNILITGAGSGLGRELAIEFSKHVVCLVLVDINRESLLETEKLLDRCSRVFVYDCDVSNNELVYKMAAKVKEDVGDVDILVNNAGIVQGKYLTDCLDEGIKKTLEVNTLAHFWTCKAFLPAMMEKNSGHIVSIASGGGKIGAPRVTDYCASKFAAIGFAESLEVELRERKLDGIKVTIVCPGHIDTGMFDGAKLSISPAMRPEYVAQEILAAILEEAETVHIPGWHAYAIIIKQFYPRWLLIKACELTGDINCMSEFTGRRQKQ